MYCCKQVSFNSGMLTDLVRIHLFVFRVILYLKNLWRYINWFDVYISGAQCFFSLFKKWWYINRVGDDVSIVLECEQVTQFAWEINFSVSNWTFTSSLLASRLFQVDIVMIFSASRRFRVDILMIFPESRLFREDILMMFPASRLFKVDILVIFRTSVSSLVYVLVCVRLISHINQNPSLLLHA